MAMANWDFSNPGMTFDNAGFTFDGGTSVGWTVDSTSVTTDSTTATTDGFSSSGGAALAGAATDATSATGALINFASVTLVAPLYTGPQGLFDPNLVWPFSIPVV